MPAERCSARAHHPRMRRGIVSSIDSSCGMSTSKAVDTVGDARPKWLGRAATNAPAAALGSVVVAMVEEGGVCSKGLATALDGTSTTVTARCDSSGIFTGKEASMQICPPAICEQDNGGATMSHDALSQKHPP